MFSNISNVVVFVADSVRYDYFPDDVLSDGTLFKTVAQSYSTRPVLTTLVTGLRPQQHGVRSVGDRIRNEVTSLYDEGSLNTSLFASSESNPILRETVQADEQQSLAELEPPFFYLELDTTPHVPYAADWEGDVPGYYASRLQDPYHLQQEYRHSIRRSLKRFRKRIQVLKDLVCSRIH